MIEAFGEFDLMATNLESGQEFKSKGWQPTPMPRAEINATEYLALGQLHNRYDQLQVGTLKNFLQVIKSRRSGEKNRGGY